MITAAEWEPLERGLAQRTIALNRFLADAYGPREIVAAGVMEERVIETAERYEAALRGFEAPRRRLDRRRRASTSCATPPGRSWCSRTT